MSDKLNYSITKDGKTKSVCVEKCENGYIIEMYSSESEDYCCKKYISSSNPFAENISLDEKFTQELEKSFKTAF